MHNIFHAVILNYKLQKINSFTYNLTCWLQVLQKSKPLILKCKNSCPINLSLAP